MMALAAVSAEPTVETTGQQTVKLLPDTMEVAVNLEATDAQFDKALATIQQKYADVEKALRGLQNAPADLKSDGPWMGAVASDQQSQVLDDITTSYMPSSASVQPGENGEVTLTMTVTARWKLTAREGLALLKETAALQGAVRAALPKQPEVGATEEQIEEMLAVARRTGESGEAPGTPHFSFTAALPADKAAEARAQAFKKARAEAEALAQAAGMKLGALRTLSGGVMPAEGREGYYLYSGYNNEPEGVARSPQVRELTFEARVDAEFDVAPAQ
jgi:uncharacterized protein YggE